MTSQENELKAQLNSQKKGSAHNWIYGLLLVLILAAGAYMRFGGIDWDEGHLVHPDERFLIDVENSILPVESISEYFDTDASQLNPHNRNKPLFVYGSLPIFFLRYLREWLPQVEFSYTIAGRYLSASADFLTIIFVYLIAARLYDRRVGILAAAFSAFAVLQIQVAHFFAVDTFKNLFIYVAVYLAVVIATSKSKKPDVIEDAAEDETAHAGSTAWKSNIFDVRLFILFGVAVAMAAASKVDAVFVAGLLPVAAIIVLSRLPEEEREQHYASTLFYLALAGLSSFLAFRVFQPYAFSGPGFFGILPNDKWIANLQEVRRLATADWPPSLQWARRPLWFSFQNLSLWGTGLPMAVAAWGGFLWMGWRALTGEWRRHIMIWSWTALIFAWQSLAFNPTMRYQLPIYPSLAIIAGWALVALWKLASSNLLNEGLRRWAKPAALIVGSVSVAGTMLYGFAFFTTYLRPEPRVAASDWIYVNVPGPINFEIATDDGVAHQPISVSYNTVIEPGIPYTTSFRPVAAGTLEEIWLHEISVPLEQRSVNVRVSEIDPTSGTVTELGAVNAPVQFAFSAGQESGFGEGVLSLPALNLLPDKNYQLTVEALDDKSQIGIDSLELLAFTIQDGAELTPHVEIDRGEFSAGAPAQVLFAVDAESTLSQLTARFFIPVSSTPARQTLRLELSTSPGFETTLLSTTALIDMQNGAAEGSTFDLAAPVTLMDGIIYHLRLQVETEGGRLSLAGAAVANETNWDLGLPFPRHGYNAFGGIYQGDLNFDMYADDNADKLERFLDILNETDYIFISSSRQWGTTTRLPERYPLTSAYYRYLLGCPNNRTIEWCYTAADEDSFEGQLGFELVEIFDRNPAIGPFEINDQFSEEAFTVYDHPKVFVFQKSDDYDADEVSQLLRAVDLSNVVRVSPADASGRPTPTLLLSDESRERQQAGGTWSQLYNVEALFNRFPALAMVLWYAAVALLGLFSYPLVRLGLSGLEDKGYPLARAVGLLLLAYLSWMSGSLGIGYTRPVIAIALLLIVAVGAYFGYRQRDSLRQELEDKWRYFLGVEGIFLAFFVLGLLIRLGNPDLWHPAFGGEKPMDFAYFNAILKSTTFPPYDPWFAGGYINYYYYGFVYVGTLVKLMGIVPAIAYNLILPTLFGLMALGIFSAAWNLFLRSQRERELDEGEEDAGTKNRVSAWVVGIGASLLMSVLGNLGSLRMVLQGFQRLGADGLYDLQSGLLTKSVWALRGFTDVLLGEGLPYGIGSWYWDPTRIMPPGDPAITEFPFFTIIYADLHAHLIALPITLIALGWALSVVFSRAWQRDGKLHWGMAAWSLLLGALAIGALRATNTWDMPAYLVLGAIAVLYSVWRYAQPSLHESLQMIAPVLVRGVIGLFMAGALVLLAFVLYQPYHIAYAQPDTNPIPHLGPYTPTSSYLVHWGVFLFVLISWMAWETRQWLASTPLSSLRKVAPYAGFIIGFLLVAIGGVLWLQLSKNVSVAWLAVPLMIWAGILLFRPKLPETKRIALFLVGTGLFLTLGVELFVIDSRMNTVFKFYLQAWTMFSAVGAAALGWIFTDLRIWLPRWRTVWQIALAGFLVSAALFPLLGGLAKVNDRWEPDAPHTLNGTAYMPYAAYADQGQTMELSQDYAAIQWMQQNIQGSPVIVEAQTPTYRWGSRYAIYTGLPTVMGWDVHQSQQRGKVNGSQLGERIQAVRDFYQTADLNQARDFLAMFGVRYIVLGQLERAYHPGEGLDKFEAQDGVLWREVFRQGDTVIYEVLPDTLALD